ncbi:MAG: cupredoxin domain-containing protein [Ignavibacteriae bacterium]|nr:cupredoxin domain-containing protein [Ignavibacteriota bacterium]
MKTYSIFLITVTLFFIVTVANSQCGMMGGGSSHKHGQSQSSSHEEHKATVSSKGYTFINDDGIQEATIVIKNGYQPSTLVVKKNIPLKLNFDMQEETCTDTVVLKNVHIKQGLEPYELTSIEFTPSVSGSFTFSCPMNMIEGLLVVKE